LEEFRLKWRSSVTKNRRDLLQCFPMKILNESYIQQLYNASQPSGETGVLADSLPPPRIGPPQSKSASENVDMDPHGPHLQGGSKSAVTPKQNCYMSNV